MDIINKIYNKNNLSRLIVKMLKNFTKIIVKSLTLIISL